MPRMAPEEVSIVFKEAHSETPRGAAIIMTVVLEAALEDCICARLIPMSNTQRDTLFGGEADFAGLAAKIDLGFSLGLYGTQTRTDLHLIRRIRNQFAHYSPRNYSHSEIAKHCRNLTNYVPSDLHYTPAEGSLPKHFEEAEEFNLRWKFLHCVSHIGVNLYEEAEKNHYQPPETSVLP
jgi:hypothetical protein